MILRLIRAARRNRDLRIARLCDTTGYLPRALSEAAELIPVAPFPPGAERVYDGDQPHCPACHIDWDGEADRCGLIPCRQHCLRCKDMSPCIRHDQVFWNIVAGLQADRRAAQ